MRAEELSLGFILAQAASSTSIQLRLFDVNLETL